MTLLTCILYMLLLVLFCLIIRSVSRSVAECLVIPTTLSPSCLGLFIREVCAAKSCQYAFVAMGYASCIACFLRYSALTRSVTAICAVVPASAVSQSICALKVCS